MANLIIKPTSGGSLILQDEGGTAAHTIDASGNHTLSGTTNNIGTVTSGTYNATIGSTAVMPAGSIIRVSDQTQGTTTTSGNVHNTWTDTVVAGAYTPVYNTSDVIVIVHYGNTLENSSGDAGVSKRLKRVISGGATTYPQSMSTLTQSRSPNYHSTAYRNANSATTTFYEMRQLTVMDSPATTSAITYTLQYGTYNTEACVIGGAYSSVWSIQFMEVKR